MKKVYLYADGGARGNPGPAGAGAALISAEGEVLAEAAHFLGHATNNVAEYTALIEGLKLAVAKYGPALAHVAVEIRMDSLLVIRQLEGRFKVKHPGLKPLHAEACRYIQSHFPRISYRHVPREENTVADALANEAMDRKGN